jgi:hypothetical protein
MTNTNPPHGEMLTLIFLKPFATADKELTMQTPINIGFYINFLNVCYKCFSCSPLTKGGWGGRSVASKKQIDISCSTLCQTDKLTSILGSGYARISVALPEELCNRQIKPRLRSAIAFTSASPVANSAITGSSKGAFIRAIFICAR